MPCPLPEPLAFSVRSGTACRVLIPAHYPRNYGSNDCSISTAPPLRWWVTDADEAYYCVGSVIGPHPYPTMVREFQRVIGDEARRQCAAELPAAIPDYVVACVGGDSNAAGTFAGFADTTAKLVGV